jgi:ribosomal-protein-alanine N-acetyltransferase
MPSRKGALLAFKPLKKGEFYKTIFCDIPTLASKRLILRKVKTSDARDMFEYARVPSVSRYTLWTPHKNIHETLGFIKHINRNYRACRSEDWGIVNKADGKFIGTIGFYDWDEKNRKAEIHYALSNRYSGQGLMSEAVKKVIEFGFKKMRLNRIEAMCMPGNKASERVMQKCGMRYEGVARGRLRVKGKFMDLKMYALLKKDIKAGK